MAMILRDIEFQGHAAAQIAARYAFYACHDERPGTRRREKPFFQALAGITGCGKTPILADAIARICFESMDRKPIVLWMSKARSVVQQTLLNFTEAGKYTGLISDFSVVPMKELTAAHLEDGQRPLLIMTTTGLFNSKEGKDGPLSIYKEMEDVFGEGLSMWDALVHREANGVRRPLFVVYDEAHNLSEQQTNKLEELEPEGYLLASATLRLPTAFDHAVKAPLLTWSHSYAKGAPGVFLDGVLPGNPRGLIPGTEPEHFLITSIDSKAVVKAQLIKNALSFDGTTAPMEQCLDDLLAEMAAIEDDAARVGITPKAIYVCNTNISDDGTHDDPDAPFQLRAAPPIRIWRYLVSQGVDPDTIAVYTSQLKLQEDFRPAEFHLFGKNEEDFELFQQGGFRHIIFNQSLQEGWDDPECYFGYIDKSIGSSVRVEQIIGRVLRQPGAKHYESPCLNVARFFLRVDKEGVFQDAIDTVTARLQQEGADILVTRSFSEKAHQAIVEGPRPEKVAEALLGRVYIDASDAMAAVQHDLAELAQVDAGSSYLKGQAHRTRIVVSVGDERDATPEWIDSETATRAVRLRWLLSAKVRERAPRLGSVLRLDSPAFDTLVQFGSPLERRMTTVVDELAKLYYQKADLAYVGRDRFVFGPQRVALNTATAFNNSLYPRYSGLNGPEKDCARALDRTGHLWHRNPVGLGGYGLPRLDDNGNENFYPDFLTWVPEAVIAIDTKGGHLLTDALAGKMFEVKDRLTTKLLVRFIVKGKQEAPGDERYPDDGFTVWLLKTGRISYLHCATMDDAVKACLKV